MVPAQHCQTPEHPHSHFLQLPASFPSCVVPSSPCQFSGGAGDVQICSPTFCLCVSVSTFGFGDPGKAFLPLWIPACSSCFTCLESCWEVEVSLQRISPSSFAQIIMAPSSPTTHPSCSSGHSPTVFPLPRRSTQVPVDQESSPRVWDLQLSCQGALIPGGIL